MKKINVLLALICLMTISIAGMAQDEITDEDLRRYALMNEVIDVMKAEISVLTNDLIKNQEGIDGKRYVELSAAKGQEAKLDELGAQEFEKKFMVLVYEKQEERKEAIKEVNQILATKMLRDGGKTYKAIKEALTTDEAVKSRYEKIKAALAQDDGDA